MQLPLQPPSRCPEFPQAWIQVPPRRPAQGPCEDGEGCREEQELRRPI